MGDLTRTPPEQALADMLERLHVPYVEQAPVLSYKVDFLVDRLVLEALGDSWHRWRKIVEGDWKRYRDMTEEGYRVVGIWWQDMKAKPTKVEWLIRDLIRCENDEYVGFAFELLRPSEKELWMSRRKL